MKKFLFLTLLLICISFSGQAVQTCDGNRMPQEILDSLPKSDKPKLEFYCAHDEFHYFTIVGLKPGEVVSPTQFVFHDPKGYKISLMTHTTARANEKGAAMVSPKYSGQERTGEWQAEMQRTDQPSLKTKYKYVAVKPILFVVNQEKKEDGQTYFYMMGAGWPAGKTLTYKAYPPQGTPMIRNDMGVDPHGYTKVLPVPFVKEPMDGEYRFELLSDTQKAELKIVCKDKNCQVQL